MGRKQQILLLHGALATSSDMTSFAKKLSNDHEVFVPDFPGHGSLSHLTNYKSLESYMQFLNSYMTENSIQEPIIFGHSVGGYIAIYHELNYPSQIKKIVTYGTKFRWSPEEAAKEIKFLDPDTIESKVPSFAAVLQKRHGASNWKQTLKVTADLMRSAGQEPPLTPKTIQRISIPVQILIGEKDRMVTYEESERAASCMPKGGIQVLEGGRHELEKLDSQDISRIIEHIKF